MPTTREDPSTRQWPQRTLCYLAALMGDFAAASWRLRPSMDDTVRQRWRSSVLGTVLAFAALARERGHWTCAARLLGAADALRERWGGTLGEPIGDREQVRTPAAAQERLGEPGFAAAYAAGRAMTLEQAVTEALGDARTGRPGRRARCRSARTARPPAPPEFSPRTRGRPGGASNASDQGTTGSACR